MIEEIKRTEKERERKKFENPEEIAHLKKDFNIK